MSKRQVKLWFLVCAMTALFLQSVSFAQTETPAWPTGEFTINNEGPPNHGSYLHVSISPPVDTGNTVTDPNGNVYKIYEQNVIVWGTINGQIVQLSGKRQSIAELAYKVKVSTNVAFNVGFDFSIIEPPNTLPTTGSIYITAKAKDTKKEGNFAGSVGKYRPDGSFVFEHMASTGFSRLE